MTEEVRALATDGVVLVDGEIVVLKRNHPPDEGTWVLPGGVVERGESAAAACAREVREEVGLTVDPITLVGLYDAPNRDPRGNASAAFLCVPRGDGRPEPREEARRVDTVDPGSDGAALPEMGFDHAEIIADATTLSRAAGAERAGDA